MWLSIKIPSAGVKQKCGRRAPEGAAIQRGWRVLPPRSWGRNESLQPFARQCIPSPWWLTGVRKSPFPPVRGRLGWGERACCPYPHPHPPPSREREAVSRQRGCHTYSYEPTRGEELVLPANGYPNEDHYSAAGSLSRAWASARLPCCCQSRPRLSAARSSRDLACWPRAMSRAC
jgi:hypothetical protein